MTNFYNPYLVIPLVTWFVAQLIKFIISAWRGKVDFRLFYNSGGMPSAHSAVVTALAVTALLLSGVSSPLFGVAAVLATIVIYDSFGVRRASGEQGAAINVILSSLHDVHSSPQQETPKLREVFGHKPSEVVAGIILGLVMSLVMTTSVWAANAQWLLESPVVVERYVYAGLLALLILSSLVVYLWLQRRFRKTISAKTARRALWWSVELPAWFGLLLLAAQTQVASGLSWRLWPALLLLGIVALQITLYWRWYRFLPAQLRAEKSALKKQRKHHKSRQKRKKKRR